MPICLLSFPFTFNTLTYKHIQKHNPKGLPYMLERAGLDVQQGQNS